MSRGLGNVGRRRYRGLRARSISWNSTARRKTPGKDGCNVSGYVLVIAEKPKAARKIAEALSGGRAQWCRDSGRAGYWVLRFNNSLYVVSSAVGHLFGLHSLRHGFPVFEYEWRPLWEVDPSAAYTKPYYELLRRLSRKATLFVNACDYDIEGSVIGYLVIKYFGDLRRALRVRFSALTEKELRRAFNRLSSLDYDMVESGLARHELDWLWGINISRALMDSVRKVAGKRVTLSAGRVQSPTLAELVRRDLSLRTFVPLPVFHVEVFLEVPGAHVIRVEVGHFKKRVEAQAFAAGIRGSRRAIVESVEERRAALPPPYPFNLPDLQSEAARVFGYSPYYTQKVAEELYLEGLISYPRTNSQKLPGDLDVKSILESLSKINGYNSLVNELLSQVGRDPLQPRNGPRDDPAHPAIYPTGVPPKGGLSGPRLKIFDLIVRRFLATFGRTASYLIVKYSIRVGTTIAVISSKRILDRGWLKLYEPYASFSEKLLPKLERGQELRVKNVRIMKKYSSPPPAYTRIRLVKWMESVGIGTEATRARTVELLLRRGYAEVKGGKLRATDLGITVFKVLSSYFNDIISVELTRVFEKYLEDIRYGRIKREEVIKRAREILSKKLDDFKSNHMMDVGRELAEALALVRPASSCVICGRPSIDGTFCMLHHYALEELVKGYIEWRKRIEDISPKDFIASLIQAKQTGEAVREVIEQKPDIVIRELASL